MIDANLLAADATGVGGTVLNIATGRAVSVNDLADLIGDVLGSPAAKEYLPARLGDVRDSWADVSAAQDVLGWEPRVSLEEGLRLTVESLAVAP